MTQEENWIVKKWRPMMGWAYMGICIFDFILGPILFTVAQSDLSTMVQWSPLTMKAGGLFHVAMGAVLGVTAWSRGQEKIRYMEYFVSNQATKAAEPATEETPEEQPVRSAEPIKKDSITK